MLCKDCGNEMLKSETKGRKKGLPPHETCTECQLRKLGWVSTKDAAVKRA